jgi:hypothetical protein
MCSQLLEAASIFKICDLSCIELLKRLKRVERADPSSDLVEYFHTFADEKKDIGRYMIRESWHNLYGRKCLLHLTSSIRF